MGIPSESFKVSSPIGPIPMTPLQYSEQDRMEIVDKITSLIGSRRHETVFFEYRENEKLFYLVHFGKNQISFSKEAAQNATTKAVQKKAKKLLSEAFSSANHLFAVQNLTIIDAVYHRIRTTCRQVHDNRKFHDKVPHQTKCYVGHFGCDIDSEFIRDTFDNLTGQRPNW
jgi:hypothetical protein